MKERDIVSYELFRDGIAILDSYAEHENEYVSTKFVKNILVDSLLNENGLTKDDIENKTDVFKDYKKEKIEELRQEALDKFLFMSLQVQKIICDFVWDDCDKFKIDGDKIELIGGITSEYTNFIRETFDKFKKKLNLLMLNGTP